MELLFSIIFYVVLAATISKCGAMSCRLGQYGYSTNTSSLWRDRYIIYIILIFTIICAIRYRVGADCESYVRGYLQGSYDDNRGQAIEPIFGLVSSGFRSLNLPRIVFLGFWAFLEIYFLYKAVYNRRYLLPYIGFLLILGPYFLTLCNGIRQAVVSCVFVYAVSSLVDRKAILRYVILILICCGIHSSAALLIFFIPIIWYNYIPNRWLSISIILLSVILGHVDVVGDYLGQGKEVLEYLGYSSYADNYDEYLVAESTITTYGPRRITQLILYLLIAWFSNAVDKYYNHDRFYRVSYCMFLIYVCATELLFSQTIIFIRPFLYFMLFVLICSAYLLSYLKKRKRVVFIVALIVASSYLIIDNIASFHIPNESSLYKTVLFR